MIFCRVDLVLVFELGFRIGYNSSLVRKEELYLSRRSIEFLVNIVIVDRSLYRVKMGVRSLEVIMGGFFFVL